MTALLRQLAFTRTDNGRYLLGGTRYLASVSAAPNGALPASVKTI